MCGTAQHSARMNARMDRMERKNEERRGEARRGEERRGEVEEMGAGDETSARVKTP